MKKTLVLIAALAAFSASAQSTTGAEGFDKFMGRATGAGGYTVTFGSGGTPIPTEANRALPVGNGWTQAGNMGVARAASPSAGLNVGGKATIPLSGGKSLPVNAISRISPASLVATAGRCLGNPICIGVATVAGGALYGWLNESGLEIDPQTGVIYDRDNADGKCINGQCFQYQYWLSTDRRSIWSSPLGACQNLASLYDFNDGTYSRTHKARIIDDNGTCVLDMINQAGTVFSEWYWPTRSSRNVTDVKYESTTWDHAASKLVAVQPSPNIVPEMISKGQTFTVETPQITGPATSPGTTTTTTTERPNSQGGTDTVAKTTTTTNNHTYNDNKVTTTTSTVVTTIINGVETEVETTPEEEKELKVCGLPNTPACKIDEEGTPKPLEDNHKSDVDSALKPITDLAANPASFWPTFPQIRWDFALPTGCAAIAIPAFSPWLDQIDVCQFMPMFHDIMSIVWILGGLFGAISIFWRSTFAKAA